MSTFIEAIFGLLGSIIFLIFFGIFIDFINPRTSKTPNINVSKKKITKIVNFKDIQENSKPNIKKTSKTLANKAAEGISDFKVVCSCGNESALPKKINDIDISIKNINQFYRKFICASCDERGATIFYRSEKILELDNIKLCELCKNPIPLLRIQINPNSTRCVRCQEEIEVKQETNKKLKGRRPI